MIKTADRRAFAAMSALGHKQTCAAQTGHVRFAPKSGHVRCIMSTIICYRHRRIGGWSAI